MKQAIDVHFVQNTISKIYSSVLEPKEFLSVIKDISIKISASFSAYEILTPALSDHENCDLGGFNQVFYQSILHSCTRNSTIKKKVVNVSLLQKRAIQAEFQSHLSEGGQGQTLSAIFTGKDNQLIEVFFSRTALEGAFTSDDLDILNTFYRHMTHFFTLSSLFNMESMELKEGIQSLKILNRPFWVVNRHLALVYDHQPVQPNTDFKQSLFVQDRNLCTNDAPQTEALLETVSDVIKKASIQKIMSSSAANYEGEKISIATDSILEHFWLSPIGTGIHQDTSLVMITARRCVPQKDQLMQTHGLTQRQAQLCLMLMQGKTLAATAQSLGISINTARNFLSACFRHLKVNNQSELIRLLYSESSELSDWV